VESIGWICLVEAELIVRVSGESASIGGFGSVLLNGVNVKKYKDKFLLISCYPRG
jgi:hypothetical protein